MTVTLESLNRCSAADFMSDLHGVYEHSPWIAARVASARPFRSHEALKLALQEAVSEATEAERLALIRAHPELAGKAAIAGQLTRESTAEQARAGLDQCSADEFEGLQRMNADYNAKFGFPFILAVKGPDGHGLTRQAIIASFARRLRNRREDEMAECLRQIHRIAELRLNLMLGIVPEFGNLVMQRAEALAAFSDDPAGLTCAYLTEAHRSTAAQLAAWMEEAGMTVSIDAVGNVVGRLASDRPDAKTLITGSHYDTVRNAGKYDGREGILVPIAVVRQLRQTGEKLPFHLEVIGFAEEEGVRFRSTFLGSSAVAGRFDPVLLDRTDADGISLRAALQAAGPAGSGGGDDLPERIAAIARRPDDLLAYIEIHIEQGPVLLERGLPAGVVTSIAGSSRYMVELTGVASHAGTTPMTMRRDAAAAAAEIVLAVEKRCGSGALVGTVGVLQVSGGSVNVVPGACRLSLDIRAGEDAVRRSAVADILAEIEVICGRRAIDFSIEPIVEAAAAPCAPWLMKQLGSALEAEGVPVFALPSGAGHDAMMMAGICDIGMLFTRCGNGGISHNPLETMTADDADLAARVLLAFLRKFSVAS